MGIMTGLLLLLWVGVTVSSAVDLQKRIIRGRDCNKTERRYHVKLTNFNGDLICGGSLVSKKWVLTAAHCWQLCMKAFLEVPGAVTIQYEYIIEAPPQIYEKGNKVHDIMLLQLPRTTDIDAVKLPDCKGNTNVKKSLQIGDEVQVAGFGLTETDSKGYKVSGEPPKLQCAKMKLVSCDELKKDMNPDMTKIYSWQHWNCYQAYGVDTCPGDSGGGVVYRVGDTDYLYGVHSFGSRLDCSKPAAFMNVCEYMDWIKKTIE